MEALHSLHAVHSVMLRGNGTTSGFFFIVTQAFPLYLPFIVFLTLTAMAKFSILVAMFLPEACSLFSFLITVKARVAWINLKWQDSEALRSEAPFAEPQKRVGTVWMLTWLSLALTTVIICWQGANQCLESSDLWGECSVQAYNMITCCARKFSTDGSLFFKASHEGCLCFIKHCEIGSPIKYKFGIAQILSFLCCLQQGMRIDKISLIPILFCLLVWFFIYFLTNSWSVSLLGRKKC